MRKVFICFVVIASAFHINAEEMRVQSPEISVHNSISFMPNDDCRKDEQKEGQIDLRQEFHEATIGAVERAKKELRLVFDNSESSFRCSNADFKDIISIEISHMTTLITVVLGLVAFVTSVIGVILPLMNEHYRKCEFKSALHRLDHEKKRYESLRRRVKQKIKQIEIDSYKANALIHYVSAQSKCEAARATASRHKIKHANVILRFSDVFRELSKAMENNIKADNAKDAASVIRFMHSTNNQLQKRITPTSSVDQNNIKKFISQWQWPIGKDEVLSFLQRHKSEFSTIEPDYEKTFSDVYDLYWR